MNPSAEKSEHGRKLIMAKEPENELTWDDVAEQVSDVRTAVDALDPPPDPDDVYGEGQHQLRAGLERIEHAVQSRINRQLEEDDTSE